MNPLMRNDVLKKAYILPQDNKTSRKQSLDRAHKQQSATGHYRLRISRQISGKNIIATAV